MAPPKIAYERVDGHDSIIRIPLAKIEDSGFIKEVLQDTFEACFLDGESHFIIDLQDMEPPSSDLVALLIELTSRARRKNGDVVILNLSTTVQNHIETFTPGNYLSFENNEDSALNYFTSTGIKNKTEAVTSEIQNQEHVSLNPKPENEILAAGDIADDPIIAKLENRVNDSWQDQVTDHTDAHNTASVDFIEKPVTGERNHLRVKSLAQNLYSICDFVVKYAQRANLDHKIVGKMKIAVYEASLNVIEHAYHSNPDHWIDVWIEYNSEMFKIIIQDYGIGFEGFSDKKYDVVSAMDGRQTGGFGLYIIMRSMDEVDYRPDPKHGNRLTMIKFLKKA